MTPNNDEQFILPIAHGRVKLSGGDHGVRNSTLIRDQPVVGEERKDDFRGYSDGSQPINATMEDREARNNVLVDRRELHLSSPRRTWSSAQRVEGRIIPKAAQRKEKQ